MATPWTWDGTAFTWDGDAWEWDGWIVALKLEAAFGAGPYDDAQHLALDGTSGTYASCPDAAALDITGAIDLRWRGAADAWASGSQQALVGKWASSTSERAYILQMATDGRPWLRINDSSSAEAQVICSEPVPFGDGQYGSIRATWRPSDGRVQFFTAWGDGDSWEQLGTDGTIALSDIDSTTADLLIGTSTGTATMFSGRVAWAQVYDGIDGTLVASPDFRENGGDGWNDGDDSGTAAVDDGQSNPWSLNGDATIGQDWVDLTGRVRRNQPTTWAGGRQFELDRMEAAVGEFILDNRDRALDPTNQDSPYWPHVRPMVRIRLTAARSGTVHPIFEGYVETWTPRWPTGNADGTVEVTIVDGTKLLALAGTSVSFFTHSTGTRIDELLDAAGWPTGRRDIDAGQSQIQAYTPSDRIVLNAIREAAEVESGVFFIDADGTAVFRDRYSRVVSSSQATFGGDTGLPYHGLEWDYSDVAVWNDVLVKPAGLTTQRVADDASQHHYGRRTLEREDVPITTELEANDAAHWLLRRYREPRQRIERVTLFGHADADTLEQALSLRIGDRVTVIRRPPGGGDPVVLEEFIEHVSHEIVGTQWVTSWRLSPAFSETVWLMGVEGYSELSETTALGY